MSVTIRLESSRTIGLNLANRNFATLWSALGLDIQDWAGEIDARIIRERLKVTDIAFLLRMDQQFGNVYDFGITEEQATRYLDLLDQLAAMGERREDRIVWS